MAHVVHNMRNIDYEISVYSDLSSAVLGYRLVFLAESGSGHDYELIVPLMDCVSLLKDHEVLHLMEQHAMNHGNSKNRPKHDHYRRAVSVADDADGPQREVRDLHAR